MIRRTRHPSGVQRPAVIIHPLPRDRTPPQGSEMAAAERQDLECEAPEWEDPELTLWLDVDGWPVINGHRVTPELCAALRRRHPRHAEYFAYEGIIELSRRLGRPSSSGTP